MANETQTRLLTVNQFSSIYDWPPIGGLRHLIFNEHKNGFHKCVRRIGRRVLIDELEFFKWVNEINSNEIQKRK